MRVLHVGIAYEPAYGYGGPVRSIRNLAVATAALGHQVTVCATDSDGTRRLDLPLDRTVLRDGVHVRYFASRRWRYYGWAPSMLVWLRANVADFDIVHIHGMYSFPQRWAAAACRRSRVPYVIAPRGSADERLVTAHKPLLKRWYVRLLDRRSFSRAAAFQYTTDAEREHSILRFLATPSFVLPNAVEARPSPGPRAPLPAGLRTNRYVVYAGRLSWKKQVDLLIRAFAAAAPAGWSLALAGPDDEQLSGPLAAVAREAGCAPRVRFLGLLAPAALSGLYRGAALAVVPSLAENFGHAVVEALAHGVPVVASTGVDVTTLPEIRRCIRSCPPTERGIADAIAAAVADLPGERRRAVRGAAVVARLFDPAGLARRTVARYRDLAKDV